MPDRPSWACAAFLRLLAQRALPTLAKVFRRGRGAQHKAVDCELGDTMARRALAQDTNMPVHA
jgi:hypothetical protein